jgi:DNA polymerase-3 subunit delta
MVGRALNRHPLQAWQAFLAHCAVIDRTAKGRIDGNAWDELLELVLHMAGTKLPVSNTRS